MTTLKRAATWIILCILVFQTVVLFMLQLNLPFPGVFYGQGAGTPLLIATVISLAVLAFWPDKPRRQ